MLKHSFVKPILLIVFLLLVVLVFLKLISFWLFFIPLFIYLIAIAVGSYFIQLNYFLVSFNKSNKQEKRIALTFDDGPIKRKTEILLDLLKQKEVKATFFLIGKNISGNENIVHRIVEDGHLIGSHSYSHTNNFPLLSKESIMRDILKGIEEIKRATGKSTVLFRPPFGVTNPNIAKAVKELKLQSIGWSIRSYDTTIKDERKLLTRLKKAKAGDIILLHDWGAKTLQILPEFIDKYKAIGFEFVGIDELMRK